VEATVTVATRAATAAAMSESTNDMGKVYLMAWLCCELG